MLLPGTRVRCLRPEQFNTFVNNHSGGMWTMANPKHGGFHFRVINNTNGCLLPLLIVFRDQVPRTVVFDDVPKHLYDDDGFLHLCVSKGTVVPAKHLRCLHYKPPLPMPDPPSPLPAPATNDADEQKSPLVCKVLVPSVVMNLAPPEPEPESEPEPEPEPEPDPEPKLAFEFGIEFGFEPEPEPEPEPPQPETPSSSGESDEPAFSSYREKRMHRNRLSAAKSRRTKREYIAALERQVDELLDMVSVLRAQNWCLQATPPAPSLEDALCPEWEELGGFWTTEMN